MGAIVTLELADDAPQHNLPWIITFGPLDDDEDWEPVVCGPYERPHALAIAHNMTEDTAFLPATRLLELYRKKELSPVAVMIERDDDIPPLGDLLQELDVARTVTSRRLAA